MAFNKKKKRRIVVDDQEYFWSATGDEGWINLFIYNGRDTRRTETFLSI